MITKVYVYQSHRQTPPYAAVQTLIVHERWHCPIMNQPITDPGAFKLRESRHTFRAPLALGGERQPMLFTRRKICVAHNIAKLVKMCLLHSLPLHSR